MKKYLDVFITDYPIDANATYEPYWDNHIEIAPTVDDIQANGVDKALFLAVAKVISDHVYQVEASRFPFVPGASYSGYMPAPGGQQRFEFFLSGFTPVEEYMIHENLRALQMTRPRLMVG